MKILLALSLSLMTGLAFAQNYQNNQYNENNYDNTYDEYQDGEGAQRMELAQEGQRHMFEFNVDSAMRAAVSFDKIKTKGTSSDNNTNSDISFNYAYGVHRFLQAGVRFNYFTGVKGSEDEEDLALSFGAILNSSEDFTNAGFVSLYVGGGWAQQFGDNSSRDDLRFATLAIGKRFPLDRWGIKHVTYTPEVALKMTNSTTDESIDYAQSLQLRILQFSVFF
jgi:hypothetical protein